MLLGADNSDVEGCGPEATKTKDIKAEVLIIVFVIFGAMVIVSVLAYFVIVPRLRLRYQLFSASRQKKVEMDSHSSERISAQL